MHRRWHGTIGTALFIVLRKHGGACQVGEQPALARSPG